MPSIRQVLLCVAVLVLWVSGVRADMISPPPAKCPAGARPTSTHAGPHCAPTDCRSAEDCAEGQKCQGLRLCVDERAFSSRAGRQTTSVVEGTCPDGKCATGTCRTRRVCVESAVGAGEHGAREAPPAPGPAPVLAGAAGADEANDLPPEPSEAPARDSSRQRSERHGCALDSVPVLLVGVALAAVALLLLWRRKR